MDNKYENIEYISLLNDKFLLPELNYENFSTPASFDYNVPRTGPGEEWKFWAKYEKKQYAEIVNEACHEGATIEEDQNCYGKLYYICSICSMQTIGNTPEEAIERMVERIIFKILRGETGLC